MESALLNQPEFLTWAFWITFALIFHTFLGYPALIAALSRLKRSPDPAPENEPTTTACVVIAARNEQDRIIDRIHNLLATNFPLEKLSIIVVSDGSTDETVRRVLSISNPRVSVLTREARSGKPACLNAGIAAAQADLIVFADARQSFEPDTILNLVRHFTDPAVGAVSGALHIYSATSAIGGGVDAYWKLERFIRDAEARWDSCIGCTGAVYAIRRELYDPIPDDTLIDDVEIPMRMAIQGFRVLYDLDARAHDSQTLEPAKERIRKRRTLAGNYQMLFRHPAWLFPWNNRLWFQLISHKYLRLAAPFLLIALLVANALLAHIPLYNALLWFHGAFYALAIIGALLPSLRLSVFSLPAGFLFLNLMSLGGLFHYLFTDPREGWQSTRLQTPPPAA